MNTKEANMTIARVALNYADGVAKMAEDAMLMFPGQFKSVEQIVELAREQLRLQRGK